MNKPSVASFLVAAAATALPALLDLRRLQHERAIVPAYENPRRRHVGAGGKVPGKFKQRERASR